MPSFMFLPPENADWISPTTTGIVNLILNASTLERILYMELMRLMGLKSLKDWILSFGNQSNEGGVEAFW